MSNKGGWTIARTGGPLDGKPLDPKDSGNPKGGKDSGKGGKGK